MSFESIARLVLADLSLGRRPAIAYAAVAVLGAIAVATHDDTLRSLGASLIMAVLIGQCFHLPIMTVFHDITRGTRAFTLALPVTPSEYAAAKLAANALLFLVPAGAAALATLLTPEAQRIFPPGLVLLILLGWLNFFMQNLGIALVTESMGAAIVTLLTQVFVLGNGISMVAPRFPGFVRFWGALETGGPVRDMAFIVLMLELMGVVTLILTLMDRKRRFL